MRKILFTALVLMALLMGAHAQRTCAPGMLSTPVPERPAGQTDVIGLRAKPIPVVRIGFIGLGMRGRGAVERYMYIDGVEVRGLADIMPQNVQYCQDVIKKHGKKVPAMVFADSISWKKLCEDPEIDLIYICTDWATHTPMAVYAMEHGKHVAVEVPAAMTIADCWKLVNTAEKTRKHCMMLENCCYDFFEMATLNMAQQGVFGEVIHGEGAYIHNLHAYNFGEEFKGGYHNDWRRRWNEAHTGNVYPTHGLGPICQIMNIHRGDKMDYLVSMSTNQFGLTKFATEKYGANSPEARQIYKMGDMNTTLIRTHKGHTILIQHDVSSPRPYDRIHKVSGTKGFAVKYPVKQIALEPDYHSPLHQEKLDSVLREYEHPFSREIGELARKVGGHGGMDFIMDYRLIYCLQRGLPLDQDVYDAVEWSCIVELSERSVLNGSMPVEIPDFTRGAWRKQNGLTFAR